MGVFRKSDEERAAKAEAKEARKATRRHAEFLATPVGQARTAFEHGEDLLQVCFSAGGGNRASSGQNGPTTTLNAVRRQGWELVTVSFVYEMEGSGYSQDDGDSSFNISGSTVGHYVFRRAEHLRVAPNEGPTADVDDDGPRAAE